MVNPDGVFLGNSRTNMYGHDLNRHWLNPNPKKVPEVYFIKKQIMKHKVDFLIDLHGHSNELNQFIYGCQNEIRSFQEYI
jgi:murein tripeptide amidase MpaA